MMGEIREKPQEKKIETMADEMADAKKEITVKGIYNADVGPGMSVAYALLCLPFWVNAMGWGNTAGFALSMGMIQIGYFIMYMVCGMYFLKLGNQVSGGIYVVFAAAFGLFGGIGNISSAVCPVLGIQYDPMLVSVCFTAAGLYLLAILPCVSYASKLGIPYVVFLGEDEIRDGIVACKDMQTGEQTTLDPKATIYRIKAGLEARNQGAVIRE